MDFTGRYQIAAPPDSVWEGLSDAKLLKECLPGCTRLEKNGDELEATVAIRIGPLKTSFQGRITLTEQNPPLTCALIGDGQGGTAGFAKGEAMVVLSPRGSGTDLTYTARVRLGGKLAQTGQRLVDGAARQLADQFFARFSAAVSAGAMPPRLENVGSLIWLTGLVAVAAILILMFTVVI